MKVLFVSSGNRAGISVIVRMQGQSLPQRGIVVNYFGIAGKGYIGYFKNVRKLRQVIKKNKPDLVHAHYSLSAIVASLAGAKPLVVSLMGSDVKAGGWIKIMLKFFNSFFRWKAVIVKSDDMYQSLGIHGAMVIPNGVDTNVFKSQPSPELKEKYEFSTTSPTVLFLADRSRVAKNFPLAQKAFDLIPHFLAELQVRCNIKHSEVPLIINASDVILLTSLWEGSPNIIKEAMACNIPVVSTGVGDVPWLFGDEPGYFLTGFEPEDVAQKIRLALEFVKNNGRTKGRDRIIKLGLDADTVAKQIVDVYHKAVKKNDK
ncbi:MAG: glycosyltransferase family 4 protein [Salinivirgaceae bacterium]|jgi:glycosyltransferase involved in cell wall biosynthesis|nr:glycosyltransferase family 4 protein [Salinivirgaceae bacterium]